MSQSQVTRHSANVKNKIYPRRHSRNYNHRQPLPAIGPPIIPSIPLTAGKVRSLWMVTIGW